jgi:hypothetical protein
MVLEECKAPEAVLLGHMEVVNEPANSIGYHTLQEQNVQESDMSRWRPEVDQSQLGSWPGRNA